MHSGSGNTMALIREATPQVETPPPVDASVIGYPANAHIKGVDVVPPPISGNAVKSDVIPSLPAPRALDGIELLATLVTLKTKMDDGLVASGIQDARHWGAQQRELHNKIAANIIETAKKLAEAKKSSLAMKFLGWLAVGLSVVAAVVTGGALSVVAAAVTVGVATLVETGVVEKMTEAIAKSLMKDLGLKEGEAKTLALGITIGIVFAISLLTLGAGAGGAANGTATWSRFGEAGASALRGLASVAARSGSSRAFIAKLITQAASNTAELASNSAKVVQISQHVSSAARIGEAISSLGAAGAGIANAVQQKEATDTQAQTLDIRQFIARLRQLQEDEMDFIKHLLLDKETTTQKVADTIERHSRSNANLIRHFG
ncbi:type III secretion system translocon subunit SctE [Sinorhizobium sp. 7-81]|uniref:type III secretion system translocon subunit SctE n=1 Tax=unclassified Sinorhizobium TaxID=2613772 RepID=UPI0024C4069F|nr:MULTISPECIES: type III secretion system translocon subunit SctE [unclassified Sinorhizobium]MDK1389329.1 type III secretion system translocon subunit SctE [Sinorhizobium sp. 7-81]MDK1492970.1 type III secretion system translocon subunit SctE [Sinorhizobium sp. 8-89]